MPVTFLQGSSKNNKLSTQFILILINEININQFLVLSSIDIFLTSGNALAPRGLKWHLREIEFGQLETLLFRGFS